MAQRPEAADLLRTPLTQPGSFEPFFEILRFQPERMWRIADIMVNTSLRVSEGDRVLLQFNPGGRQLAAMIGYQAGEKGAAVLPRCVDQTVEAAILAGVGKHHTPEVEADMAFGANTDVGWATKVAFVRCVDNPAAMNVVEPSVAKDWQAALKSSLRTRVERRKWTLIYIPTPAEALLDKMSYPEYVDMFLQACDRDWGKIHTAQQILVDEVLNPGERLEIAAGNGTSLKMSVAEQTFANSTVDLNVPGSEIFSSPVRGTIEGVLKLPYPVMFGGKQLPDLILVFDKGRVVKHYTSDLNGQEWVEQQLNADEGAREVGEVAFGTNRVFDRPMLNGLFVEKVGGSGHIAVGAAYQMKEYAGRPVHLDNGVRSQNHIDLTYMMLPQYGGGKIMVDGQIIQENGDFVDPRLAILNSTDNSTSETSSSPGHSHSKIADTI